jgi:proline iminopeptidase
MRTLSFLVVLLIAITFFGCKNHNQSNKNKEELSVSKSGELVFGDKKITYFIEGEGMPCIVCADAIIQSNCISNNLKKNFKFIFAEPRFSSYYMEQKNYSNITMDSIVDDIEILRKKLGYDKIYVLGHSIIGLIALEYGRKYPQNTVGVIMINTPPYFHNDYMDFVWSNFKENASEGRRRIYEMNNEKLKKMNKDSLTGTDIAILEETANVPVKWRDSVYNITPLIHNIQVNTEGWNHFFSFIQDYIITKSEIKVPIFLSLGSFDFIVPQSLWDEFINKFPTLTVKRFKKSGHFPQVEEQELFDHQLLDWIKTNKN